MAFCRRPVQMPNVFVAHPASAHILSAAVPFLLPDALHGCFDLQQDQQRSEPADHPYGREKAAHNAQYCIL